MFVRTLPSKTEGASNTDFGVAAIAARIRQERTQWHLLKPVSVYCGTGFAGSNLKDIIKLLNTAGAAVLNNSGSAVKKFQSLSDDDSPGKVVILCSDKDPKLSNGLRKEVRKHAGQVMVVNVYWLYDSVSAGAVLGATAYKPNAPGAQELWKLAEDAA